MVTPVECAGRSTQIDRELVDSTAIRGNEVQESGAKVSRRSQRWDLVVDRAARLLEIATNYRAGGVALCGSVSRREDHDKSDIDFYVETFELDDEGGPQDRIRADEFIKQVKAELDPFDVDIRPLPGWLLDPAFEETMRRDAIPLERLVQDH